MMPENKQRLEVLTDVPSTKLSDMVQSFESAGASVKVSQQPNGKWKVEALFTENSRYQASGVNAL